jgi:hypothetical protein
MRRIAKILRIHRLTVARKRKFLSEQGAIQSQRFLKKCSRLPFKHVQLDEMETFEHSKCKPLSIALIVSDDENRKRVILGFKVSVMPAKGPLASISREKYGLRRDHRADAIRCLLKSVKPLIHDTPKITSDQNPRYPNLIREQWDIATHIAVKGRRGCIVGQGELKKIGFDPLFSLNHTCAMFRANVNRLFRKTWCTTKKISALEQHLNIYMAYHNEDLIRIVA